MPDAREAKILEAEEAIRLLAEELARAKGVGEQTEETLQRLLEASERVARAESSLESTAASWRDAATATRESNAQVVRNANEVSTKVSEFVEQETRSLQKLREGLEEAIANSSRVFETKAGDLESMGRELKDALLETGRTLENALSEMRRDHEKRLEELSGQIQKRMNWLLSASFAGVALLLVLLLLSFFR